MTLSITLWLAPMCTYAHTQPHTHTHAHKLSYTRMHKRFSEFIIYVSVCISMLAERQQNKTSTSGNN